MNAQDRSRVISVITGIVNGINHVQVNATYTHCHKSIRMLLRFYPIANLAVDEAMLRVIGTSNNANVTFATNNDLVNRIYGVTEIRTEILNELNRP